ncbi:helix-turn-helix domain-containing protein [Roseomonas terrae]|uniref:Helix-turn-helix domain-containing protein n=1 Tax=Neoroseomonas terrae TaxID=424799 RepID=A0ABS5EN21_9PROT|nr:helix-turn-helix domain-containing protein [Neoroseomonas terrae]MBR0652002.1 helix-turn-helix domain-containing protein [Neoroseomonas terrae]
MSATAASRGGRPQSRDTVQSIGRAVDLLRLIATRGARGARISDLVAWSGLPAPTAHRILKSLQAEGLVTHTAAHEYRIGPLAYELGLAAASRPHPADICAPVLEDLAQRTGHPTHLLIPSGLEMVCIQRAVPSSYQVRPSASEAMRRRGNQASTLRWVGGVGVRRPIGVAAGGQVILSEMPDAEMEQVLKANADAYRRYFTGPDEVRVAVQRTRHMGYAVTASGTPRFFHLGVAVHDGEGKAVAALKILRLASETRTGGTDRLLALLNRAALEIQRLSPLLPWTSILSFRG